MTSLYCLVPLAWALKLLFASTNSPLPWLDCRYLRYLIRDSRCQDGSLWQIFIQRPPRQIWNDNSTCATVPDDNNDKLDDIIRVNWELPVSSTILKKILRKTGQKP